MRLSDFGIGEFERMAALLQVPQYGLTQCVFKIDKRSPVKLSFEALWVAGVAKVVPRTIFGKADELLVAMPVPGAKFVENSADFARYI